MKKHNFLPLLALFISFSAYSQYYTAMGLAPGNPGTANKDSDYYFALNAPPAGSNIIYNYNAAAQYALQYLPAQTLPFSFNFNGGAVTKFIVSTSGYITFANVSGDPAGNTPASLPSSLLPDSTVCIWGFDASAGGGEIYTKVFGASPNQQLWITWWLAGNPANSNSVNIWSIVLEQTSNNIYIVDQWGDIAYSGGYTQFPLSLGVQLNASKAWTVPQKAFVEAHTWTPAYADNLYYEFSPDSANAYTPQAKMPLIEEFMQASCGPCYDAAPNIDTVMKTNRFFSNIARYHVDWPGTDYINNVIQTPFIGTRVSFYGVDDVPDAKLDGFSDIYPGPGGYNSLSSLLVQDEEARCSPFQISLTDSFDVATDTYYALGSIKAFHTFSSGIRAMAILTVDTIEYSFDQSTENPGNNSTYLLNFPQAAEDILPSTSGSALSAFTAVGQTQTISYSWKKNHAWGGYTSKKCYCYDSTNTHITLFVYNASSHYIYNSVSAAPGHKVGTGVNNLTFTIPHSPFMLYPNPAGTLANVAFNLDEQTNVTLDIYNLVGQNVYHAANGLLPSGDHVIQVNTAALQNGIYFVKYSTDNSSEVKKLVIEK